MCVVCVYGLPSSSMIVILAEWTSPMVTAGLLLDKFTVNCLTLMDSRMLSLMKDTLAQMGGEIGEGKRMRSATDKLKTWSRML